MLSNYSTALPTDFQMSLHPLFVEIVLIYKSKLRGRSPIRTRYITHHANKRDKTEDMGYCTTTLFTHSFACLTLSNIIAFVIKLRKKQHPPLQFGTRTLHDASNSKLRRLRSAQWMKDVKQQTI